MKMHALHGERARVREFYLNLLGASLLPAANENLDLFRLSDGFHVGVFYGGPETVLTNKECLRATWLEIMTTDVEGLKARLLELGVEPIDFYDKSHFYFHAPGGQVFRLAPESERK